MYVKLIFSKLTDLIRVLEYNERFKIMNDFI